MMITFSELRNRYDDDPFPVFAYQGDIVIYMNIPCLRVNSGIDCVGDTIDGIVGDDMELTFTRLAGDDREKVMLNNFVLGGETGTMELFPGEITVAIFRPANKKKYLFLHKLRGIKKRLAWEEYDLRQRSTNFIGHTELFASHGDIKALTDSDIMLLRIIRRKHQIETLEHISFTDPPEVSVDGDIYESCRRFFRQSRKILPMPEPVFLPEGSENEMLFRNFCHQEFEQMLACFLVGGFHLNGGEWPSVTVYFFGSTLRIDITSESDCFCTENFKSTTNSYSTKSFEENGCGLELIVAGALAKRFDGTLTFSEEDGHGNLSLHIIPYPDHRGFTVLHNERALRNSDNVPTYIVELSELFGGDVK